jgi:hypothetical protein
MNNSIEISQSNNQYMQRFNSAVLNYEMLILEERQQKKQGRPRNREEIKKVKLFRSFSFH